MINLQTLSWGLFIIFVIAMLVLDIKVFHKNPHEVRFKEAIGWSVFWIVLALLFAVGVHFYEGHVKAMEFVAGYLIEKSLSVDNLFVFLAVFSYFNVPTRYQHSILFWGIIGALVMRAFFIVAGVALLAKFHFLFYVFGAILLVTAYKLAFQEQHDVQPQNNPVVKLFVKFFPVSTNHDVGTFFVVENGKKMATYLFIVLLVIETTDVIFAVDSIPAVLAVSRDPFIVFSSNVFAILGLRALFFALADALRLFHYLNYGLAIILAFVGIKMIISSWYHVPIWATLTVVCGVLALSVIASLLRPKRIPLP